MRMIAVIGLAAMAAGASAQVNASQQTLCDPKSNAYDAVTAAPDQHNVLFEDEHVRVLEILLPPLSAEPIHIHALPSVIMGETGGTGGAKFLYTEYRFSNGKFVETAKNEISPTAGYRTVWTGPEGPHSITNIGPVPVRFTRIEIKPEACAR
jgi:hypothetical protein